LKRFIARQKAAVILEKAHFEVALILDVERIRSERDI